MENCINRETITKLIEASRGEGELLEFIFAALTSFEEYHGAVMADQLFPLVYSGGMEGTQFRERRADLDRRRTAAHNAMLANVNLLNRMAASAGLAPVYAGTVSEDRPYRRQVADAVFDYISSVIADRS